MWLKKKSVLQGEGHYNSNTAYDGTDWRTDGYATTWTASNTLPSAADANNYFYLPALGDYYSGKLYNVGNSGYYWSSTANPRNMLNAYDLWFGSGYVKVWDVGRSCGLRIDGFE